MLIVVCTILLLSSYLIQRHFSLTDGASFGQAFGGASALFSGMAFAALIYTVLLQKAELALTRADIAEQRFESFFFELLRLHRNTATGLRARPLGPTGPEYQGLPAFEIAAGELAVRLRVVMSPPMNEASMQTFVSTAFESLCLANFSDFGHYLRELYQLVRFIDESGIPDKERYTSLVRAQLSSGELSILFVNGLSEAGKGFKPLVEKYALLKGARVRDEFDQYRSLYRSQAYGS